VQDPAKFTQIWIWGLKTNHLASLLKAASNIFMSENKRLNKGQKLQFSTACAYVGNGKICSFYRMKI
jgi:hypothetical protein